MILGAALFFVHGSMPLLNGLLFGLAIILTQLLTPLVNALATESVNQGKKLNFSAARAVGSIGYSVMSYSLGSLVSRKGITVQPVAVVIVSIVFVMIIAVYPFRKKSHDTVDPAGEWQQDRSAPTAFFKRYRSFSRILIGCSFIYICHVPLNNFTYQIVVSKGGGSAEMGTAMALAAISELLTMILFPVFLKKRGAGFWLGISGIFYTLKAIGSLAAWNILSFYAVQFLQPFGWGLMAVSSVYYTNQVMEEKDKIKGQAYMTMTLSIGNVFGALLGGALLDIVGVSGMIIFSIISGCVGTVIVMRALSRDYSEFRRWL